MGSAATPDVAIVGGGIAGSSLAIALANQGFDVHLTERSDRFHDRIRGEAIHPWGVNHLRAIGLYDLAIERAGASEHWFWQRYIDQVAQPPYRWADDFPASPNGLGVSHVSLQNALIDEAARVGVSVHRPAEVRMGRSVTGPVLTIASASSEITLAPRLVVGADGERSSVRQWMGGSFATDPMHHMLGGVLIEGLGLAADRIHQAFSEGGFIFASPFGSNLTRVYLVSDPDRAMAIQRSTNPARDIVNTLRDSTPTGLIAGDWRAIGPAGFFPNATRIATIPHSTDTVLIGDGSGRNDPSQGHGLSLAFRDVHLLTKLLTSNGAWGDVPDRFHARKAEEFEVLRQHAHWNERTATETGPEIDQIREDMARSRAIDPTAGGFAAIFARGPSGLVANDAARRHYFGLDLRESPIQLPYENAAYS